MASGNDPTQTAQDLSTRRSTTFNTSTGFAQAGFNDLVKKWLGEIFPNGEGGGVICSIDNLELLRESELARTTLEALRDELLTVRGLRWILCGSLGIVRSLASTPRLKGYLHSPVEILDVNQGVSGDILNSRIAAFSGSENAYLPLNTMDFTHLFQVLHGNIRDSLSEADNFCNWVADGESEYRDEARKHNQFMHWLRRECKECLEAARPFVTPRPLKLFKAIAENDGQCSPGAFGDFGFDTQQAMRSQIISLEAANLVKSVRNEDDNRRKTIFITPAGWMAEYAIRTGMDTLFDETEDLDQE